MGYGRICSKAVYAVFLGTDIDGEDAAIKFQVSDFDSSMVTVIGPAGSIEMVTEHTLLENPTELYLGRYGTDNMIGYYIICGRMHIGGGIWCDGGSFSARDVKKDEKHFKKHLRVKFDAIKAKLGLPAELQPTFKTFMSFGQVQY